jgi:hypothetical protein
MITILQDKVGSQVRKYTFVHNPIPFVVTSNFINRKNFKFIFRTYIDNVNVLPTSSELVSENKVYKLQNVTQGHFDASSILSQRLSYDFKWDTIVMADRNNSVKNYNVGIGEEFSREIKITSVNNNGGFLRLIFDTTHNLREGDAVVIVADDPNQFNQNTNVVVTTINSPTAVTTNIAWTTALTGMTGVAFEAEKFTDNYYSPLNGVDYVGFVFPNYGSGNTLRPTRFRVGDLVTIRQDAGFTHASYNRTATVLQVNNVTIDGNNYTRVITNIRWAGNSPANAGVMFSRNNYYLPDLAFTNTGSQRTYVVNGKLKKDKYPNFDFTTFTPTGDASRFLTNCPKTLKILTSQFHTLAFLQGTSINTSRVEVVEFKFYDNSNTLITSMNVNNPDADSINRLKQSKVIGVGTKNIDEYRIANSLPAINWSNVSYYTVRLYDNTNTAIRSETIRFNVDCESRYKTHRIAFLNALGEFDYFNFKQGYNKKQKSELKTFTKRHGSVNNGEWSYTKQERGTTVFNSYSEDEIVLRSDWLSEAESVWLKELFTSKEVYLFDEENSPVPIVILDTEVEEKVNIQMPLFRLEVTFKFANSEKY